MQKVYIELVFLDNFIVNLLVILLASRLTKTPVRWRRYGLAAALGGAYGCLALGISGLLETAAVKIAAGFAICFAAYFRRGERGFLKNTCAFWAASFVLAGAIYACMFSFGEPASIGSVVIVRAPVRYVLLGLLVGAVLTGLLARVRKRVVRRESESELLRLTLGERSITVKAFADSGNLARDPVGGKSVVFLSRAAAAELLSRDLLALMWNKTPCPTDRLRIIPCATAAGLKLLYGVEIDGVALKDDETSLKAVVCLSDVPLPHGCGAIAGTELLDELRKGANNEVNTIEKADGLGDAEAQAGGESGLHQRERGASAASDAAGGSGAAPAAGRGGQIGPAGAH